MVEKNTYTGAAAVDNLRKPEDYLNEPEDVIVEAGIRPDTAEDFLHRANPRRTFPKREHLPRFARLLRDLRIKANIERQMDVEKATDGAISRNKVSLYEQGKVRDIPPEALRQLAAVYGVPYEQLVRALVQEKYGIDLSPESRPAMWHEELRHSGLVNDLVRQIAAALSTRCQELSRDEAFRQIEPAKVMALLATFGIEHLSNRPVEAGAAANSLLQNVVFDEGNRE
ncbi:MAG: helix-turn-helix transcriptional regulator [Myxococcota bacterium]|nr:helix-turn-helix transcriptional regulator [Myxococcota bacterium]